MATRKTKGDEQAGDAAAPAAGGVTGLAAGAAIGAAVGGPLGAGVGAAATWDDAEPHFRSHWESGPYKSITKWEDVAPAYRYGYESGAGDTYRGKSYDEVSTHLRQGFTGKGKYEDYEPMIRSAYESRTGSAGAATTTTGARSATTESATVAGAREAVIPVVEEELQVGKRKVQKGGVRVETTVTETPVEEKISLHEEHVDVKRRPVNRAATSADVAFKEGTIEMTESAEEAVVSKRARVVEEVVISKHASDRTETVRDTVRKTDVDVAKTGGEAHVGPVQWETIATDFQKHYKSHHGKSGYTFDQYTPAYRYGYNLANDTRYQGEWTTVEPEARRHWEEKNQGTWEDFKDAVHHAWEKVRGH